VLLGKANPPHFCTPVDAYLLIAEFVIYWSREEARAGWEYILTLDQTIPANRVAQIEARKRLQKQKGVSESPLSVPRLRSECFVHPPRIQSSLTQPGLLDPQRLRPS
jgi:hypothetical protein